MKRARVAACTAAGIGLFALAACSATPSAAPIMQQQQQQQQTPQPSGANIGAMEVSSLGMVVTDEEGRTLYRFDKDSTKPVASNCDGECTAQWPPLLAESSRLTVTGVDTALIGTVKRKDGTKQVTLGGWPLYRFAKDAAPGEAKGQGVNGAWFAATPEGRKAAGAAVPAGAGQSGTGQPPADGGSSGDDGY